MRIVKFVRDNSLSIALFALFVVSIGGAVWAGWLQQNETLVAHHRSSVGFWSFLASSSFIDGLAVNWQAAVLQLASLIVFSSFLYQRGSPHSRNPDRHHEHEKRRSRLARYTPDWLRRNSLFVAFLVMFVASFAAHAGTGFVANNQKRAFMGETPMTFGDYLVSSRFWWQNFQTWQAEYLAIVLYLLLSIVLRQEGSAVSKPENAPDSATGEHNS